MDALLLVDHGSRHPPSNAQLEAIAEMVRLALDGRALVGVAHMEIAPPGIAEALSVLVDEGAQRVVVVPYFLAPGRHATEDIPRLVQEAASQWPGLDVRVADCLGVDAALVDLVLRRACAAGFTPL